MPSLVIFFDARDISSKLIVPKLVAASLRQAAISDITLLCAGRIPRFRNEALRMAARIVRRLIQIALASGRWESSLLVATPDVRRLARTSGVRLLEIPDGDPNGLKTMEHLTRLGPSRIGVNIYCRRLFKKELLEQFDSIVNYHNGELPRFRGIRCSNWSIYLGHRTSAYSFHRMDSAFDAGKVFFTRAIKVQNNDTPAELEMKKALDASKHLDSVIKLLIGGEQGRLQEDIGCSCNRAAYEIATTVPNPSSLTLQEWRLRLKSFLAVETSLSGDKWVVTGIKESRRQGSLSFVTADQKIVAITGLSFWPARLVLFLQKLFGPAR